MVKRRKGSGRNVKGREGNRWDEPSAGKGRRKGGRIEEEGREHEMEEGY